MTKKKKQVVIKQKQTQKTTKTQGPMSLGRTTFVDEIIQKYESKTLLGPWKTSGKGSTTTPQVVESPITSHAEFTTKMKDLSKAFKAHFFDTLFLHKRKFHVI